MLETLTLEYPVPPDYGYGPAALEKRGRERANEVLRLPAMRDTTSFLEVGCWDGMVGCALAQAGKSASGVDYRSAGFDQRAIDAGVDLRQMNAEALDFADNAFDAAFSYNAFEHFANPDRVLAEMIRVVKPGGLIWLVFGPLYLSPYGEHAYRIIPVPYCHVLWTESVLDDYTDRHGLPSLDYSHVNRWHLGRFRKLLMLAPMSQLHYREGMILDHLDLIKRYPSCFKAKTTNFEDLIVDSITGLYRVEA
jgi:SAM-dependent methyltransferase